MTENRYARCNRLAEETKARKREYYDKELSYTWETPEAYLDDEAFNHGDRVALALAHRAFRSLESNPHTKMINIPMGQIMRGMDVPQTAMVNLLQAILNTDAKNPTSRQKQALKLQDEAIQLGVTPSTHIARKLGITPQSALRLLKRAKMVQIPDFVHYVYDSVHKIDSWSPAPKQVKAMMKSKPRICAYCGTAKTYDGSKPLCFSCHSKLGTLRDEAWDKRTRAWLRPEIQRIEREHRQWAIDNCYRVHYGEVSIEEYEFLMDAA